MFNSNEICPSDLQFHVHVHASKDICYATYYGKV